MTEQTQQENVSSTFSLRRINSPQDNENKINTEDNKFTDKIKILELSNLINDWEQELLFSENGFFSLKGIEAKEKSKDFLNELEKFINSKIDEISFTTEYAKDSAKKLKELKLENIKKQILNHSESELYEWETEVYDNYLESALKKAVAYKNSPKIVQNELIQALSVMKMIADKEQWNSKIFTAKKQSYISDFYYSIISSFLTEKDITFLPWFNTFKNHLKDDKREKLEKISKETEKDITAYNWSVELFSYNLDEVQNEKEIKKLKDKELELKAKEYLEILKNAQKENEENEEKLKVEKNWENILSFVTTEPAKALLYIDKEQKEDIQKAQREYIKKITEKGNIETDKTKYLLILQELLTDPTSFLRKSLFEFKHLLSDKDFLFFEQLQKEFDEKYFKVFSDYKFLFEQFKEQKITSDEDKYDFILSYQKALEEYEEINSKAADIEKRNKIISALFERHPNNNEKGVK